MEQTAPQTDLIGATVGNYKVVSKLGEGGMGSVYLAEHPLIGKKVALKVLHAEFASNDEVVSRFFTEARSVNNIQHPNIVDIVDYGVIPSTRPHEPGMVYFIMEFLDGDSLSMVIHRESPLPPERSLRVCIQIADALAASHAQQIVHRDLKPDNVILTQRGRERDFVKVLDFGIAKLTGDQPGSRRTRTGIVMGTPAYMSPEQCEGRGDIDHRTDVYALGILLYEMLTGRVPFVGNGYGEVLVQHLTQKPARPSTIRGVIPPHVELVVMKALEKNRDHRYPTMDEFIKALTDPVAYVEAHGGLNGYLAGDSLANATGESSRNKTMIATPSAMTAAVLAGAPPAATPQKPTTLSGGAGEVADPTFKPARSRTPIYVAAGLGVAVFAILGIFALGGGGDTSSAAAPEPPPEEPTVNPDLGRPTPPDPPPAPPPVVEKPKPAVIPAEVKIKVVTNPPGASVIVGSETKSRGVTPLEMTLKGDDGDVLLLVKLDGYEPERKTIIPNQNRDLDLTLTRKPGAPEPPVVTPVDKPADKPVAKPADKPADKPTRTKPPEERQPPRRRPPRDKPAPVDRDILRPEI